MMNMNKVSIVLLIATIGIVVYIGGLTYYEMAYELEQHPEIKDIGGPPVITDLRPLIVTVVVAAIFCGLALKMNPDKKKPFNHRG